MLIYFSINMESSTSLNSLLVFRSSVRSFHPVWFTCSSPRKGEKKQTSVVLSMSVSGKGLTQLKNIQLRVCLWLQIMFFRRLWLFSLKSFLSFCFVLVAFCGNKIILTDCSLGLSSLIFSPEMVKAFVISPSNLIMLIQ